ncbi:MAG TPA: glycosyl hydrolase family 28-related protein, partial [Tepidisphaeraceae bacterium]|nr:glycosyl hydrolase family 28-related protein [Tepidisphaeraceae bacterium]
MALLIWSLLGCVNCTEAGVEVPAQARDSSTAPALSSTLSTTCFSSLADAVRAIGSKVATLVIAGDESVNENLTIPSTLTLEFGAGKITVAPGKTLTINSMIDPGARQVFGAGGSIRFGLNWHGVLNAAWWGAKGDGADRASDSYPAIQAAIDAGEKYIADYAAATSGGNGQGARVVLPGGTYLTSAPLRITSSLLSFGGDKTGPVAVIQPKSNSVQGYMLVVGPEVAPIPTTKSLASGSGVALSFDGSNSYHFNLRELAAWDLDGLNQLSIELYFKKSASTSGYILSSQNWEHNNSPGAMPVAMGISTTDHVIEAQLRVGGTLYTLHSTTAPAVGTTYKLQLTYDGSTIRLGINNTIEATAPASGSVSQQIFEDVILGPTYRAFPEAARALSSITGAVDSIRLSSTARSISGSSMDKFSSDKSTLFLLNFDELRGILAKATVAGGGDGWLAMRREGFDRAAQNVTLDNLTICGNTKSSGVYLFNAPQFCGEKLVLRNLREGIRLQNTNFLSKLKDVSLIVKRVGIYNVAASGVQHFEDVDVASEGYGIVGEGYMLENAFLHGPQRTAILATTGASAESAVTLS